MPSSRSLLVWTIFLSALLHGLGVLSPQWLPESWFEIQRDKENVETIEVELQKESAEAKAQQFVPATEDPPPQEEDPEKLKEQARFLSDRMRRFKEELQASVRGETKNRPNLKPNLRINDPNLQNRVTESEASAIPDSNGLTPITRDFNPQGRSGPQISTIGENLPKDLQKGMFNVLNTDYLTFYSFYERFGSMVRFSWSRHLERLSTNTQMRQILNSSNNREWTTEMKVWLRPNGEIFKVVIMKPSGIPMLDKAHQQTFYDVGLVPNPPKEMVKEDGTIPVDVALTIFYEPQAVQEM